METRSYSKGILDGDASGTRDDVFALLTKADGVRAQEIKESLATNVEEELGHARQFAARMVNAILRDEQAHRRLFEGFLREYEMEGAP
jgi:rubrerythrin